MVSVKTALHSGIVLDAQQHPVANATVEIYRRASVSAYLPPSLELKGTVRTDDQGEFQFPVLDSTTVLVAHKAGLAPGLEEVWHLQQQDVPVMLMLTRPAEIAGIVINEDGQPVSGAEVWASKVAAASSQQEGRLGGGTLTGQPARQLFSTRTGRDGRFYLAGLPDGCGANLAVSKPGMAMRRPQPDLSNINPFLTQCLAGQTNVELVVEPGANIRGKVVVQSTGRPLEGVTLWLRDNDAAFSFYNGRQPVKSASDGTFQFGGVAAGSYAIIAHDGPPAEPVPAWVVNPVQVKVATGESLADVQISAVKGGILTIRAMDQTNGKPLSGVRIAADKQLYQVSATTDDKGTVQLRLPTGKYHFSAMKAYWSLGQGLASVENGQTNHCQIELSPPLTLKGTVFGLSGAPASNVPVSFAPGGSGGTTTDRHGRFEILWNPQDIVSVTRRCLFARDWAGNLAAVTEIGPATTNVNLHLQPALALSGLVTDESGRPIAKAQLRLTLHFGLQHGTGHEITTDFDKEPYQTDAQGRFTYAVLPAGLDYGINVWANGYGATEQNMSSAETKTNNLELRFMLKRANLKISGRVVDQKGKPLAGAELTAKGEGQPYRSAHSDTNGYFEFKQLCSGEVQVGALWQGHFEYIPAQGGETNLIIKIAIKRGSANP